MFEDAVRNFSMRYVSKKMGVSDMTVSALIDKFGLRKVRGYQSATTYYKLHPELLKARNEKISQRRKKLIRRERFNIRMGLHQESNVYLSPYSLSLTDYSRRSQLRRDGYVVPRTGRFVNDDPKAFYYDKDTFQSTRMNKLPVDFHPSDQDVCFKCRHRFAELLPTPHLFCNRSGKVIHDWEICLFYEPQNGRGTMTQTYYRKLSKKDHQ